MNSYRRAAEAFEERFEAALEDGILKDGTEPPEDWEDDLLELADNLVPIYNVDRVREWQELSWPDPEEGGLGDSIMDQIGIALYEDYLDSLRMLATEAGFDA